MPELGEKNPINTPNLNGLIRIVAAPRERRASDKSPKGGWVICRPWGEIYVLEFEYR